MTDGEIRIREAIKKSCRICVSRSLGHYLNRFIDPGAAARREALLAEKMGLYAKLAEGALRERIAREQ